MKKYIWIVVSLLFVYVIGNSIYDYVNKSAKATRITCQKKVTSFERTYIKKDIKIAQQDIENTDVKFNSSIQKAKFAKSKLFEFVKLSKMDDVLKKSLDSYVLNTTQKEKKLEISYYIYENDVDDPGKKTEKSKLYAGYVVFRFYNQKQELIYQVQIDFMDKKGADLPQRIKCAVESFMTL